MSNLREITATVKFIGNPRNLEIAKANLARTKSWPILDKLPDLNSMEPFVTQNKHLRGFVKELVSCTTNGRTAFMKLLIDTDLPENRKGWKVYIKLSDLSTDPNTGLVGEYCLYHN